MRSADAVMEPDKSDPRGQSKLLNRIINRRGLQMPMLDVNFIPTSMFKTNPNFLKEMNIEGSDAIDAIREITSKNDFMNKLALHFAKTKYIEDASTIKIERPPNIKGYNACSHFIITHGRESYHAKSAMHSSEISLGSKFNEIAFYKLNEILKIGPRCNGIVSEDGILMIITEDLKFRKIGDKKNKEIFFVDNQYKKIINTIPTRERDNVHRCVTEIAINLFFYRDVENNHSNTGFKTTKEPSSDGSQAIKEKPFIIDFTLASSQDLITKYQYDGDKKKIITKYAEEVASFLNDDSQDKKMCIIIFQFNQEPQIIKEALKKLFLKENGDMGKIDEAIENAFEYAISLAESSDMTKENLQAHKTVLEFQKAEKLLLIKTFLENGAIKAFLEQESKNIKEGLSSRDTSLVEQPPEDPSNPSPSQQSSRDTPLSRYTPQDPSQVAQSPQDPSQVAQQITRFGVQANAPRVGQLLQFGRPPQRQNSSHPQAETEAPEGEKLEGRPEKKLRGA